LLLSSEGFAAELTLTVKDEGKPLSMAEVIVIDAERRVLAHSGFTDKQGRYRHTFAPGRLEVMITKDEYAKAVLKDIRMGAQNIHQDVELIPSAFVSIHTPAPTESDGCEK
jgi:hypothetical protein